MCGILGVVNLENRSPMNKKSFSCMLDLLSHRGPDDSGIFSDENVIFGHRRLSILDLSSLGKQPMTSFSKDVCIIHNGEVYNFREIREELKKRGYKFRSSTDTEVILNAYIEYGIDCVNEFRGMFAFAIYDKSQKKVFVVRDRIGIKPLYYSVFDGKFIFSSEVKAILNYPNFPREEDVVGISSYLSYRYPIHDYTLFKKVKSLLPGHYVEIDICKKKFTIKKYWDLPIVEYKEDKGEVFYVTKLKNLLIESVGYRMISDVPIGAYLSGGIDSSIVVALMSQLRGGPIKTFTIGFKEEGFNEFDYARKVADMYRTEHYEILLTAENYIEEMKKLIEYKDAPLGVANEPALYVMSKELKKYITVVLSGEGSDEIFGGYGRIFRSPFDYKRLKLLEKYEDLGSEEVIKLMKENLIRKYGYRKFQNEVDFFLFLYQYISWEEKETLFSKEFLSYLDKDKLLNEVFYDYFDRLKGLTTYEKFIWIFEKIHIVGLLHRVDTTTMATSVEARVPFVDHKVVEFAMTIPVKYKVKWKSFLHKLSASIYNTDQISEVYDIPKYILKKTFESDLPKEVVWRKKLGFPVPIHKWFGKTFRDFAKDIFLSHEARQRGIYNIKFLEQILNGSEVEKNHKLGLKLWMLLNLELWFRKYIDRLDVKWNLSK